MKMSHLKVDYNHLNSATHVTNLLIMTFKSWLSRIHVPEHMSKSSQQHRDLIIDTEGLSLYSQCNRLQVSFIVQWCTCTYPEILGARSMGEFGV